METRHLDGNAASLMERPKVTPPDQGPVLTVAVRWSQPSRDGRIVGAAVALLEEWSHWSVAVCEAGDGPLVAWDLPLWRGVSRYNFLRQRRRALPRTLTLGFASPPPFTFRELLADPNAGLLYYRGFAPPFQRLYDADRLRYCRLQDIDGPHRAALGALAATATQFLDCSGPITRDDMERILGADSTTEISVPAYNSVN